MINNSYVIVPKQGLSNRLRVIFSWLEYACKQNKSLIVIWNECDYCPGFFLDYFECPTNCKLLTGNTGYSDKDVDYIGYNAHESIPHNKKIYEKLFLKDHMLNILQDICKIYKNYDSVHIRRTDFNHWIKEKNKTYTSDDVFINFIDKSDKMVYLATDNIETKIKYKKLFPNKILDRDAMYYTDKVRQTSLKDSILDTFLCINSQNFLGTQYSSVTHFINIMRK